MLRVVGSLSGIDLCRVSCLPRREILSRLLGYSGRVAIEVAQRQCHSSMCEEMVTNWRSSVRRLREVSVWRRAFNSHDIVTDQWSCTKRGLSDCVHFRCDLTPLRTVMFGFAFAVLLKAYCLPRPVTDPSYERRSRRIHISNSRRTTTTVTLVLGELIQSRSSVACCPYSPTPAPLALFAGIAWFGTGVGAGDAEIRRSR